jgi:hypothetical protein
MMPSGGGRSKPALPGLRVRLSLSGVTPGDREELRFRRASFTALHAEPLAQGETRWGFRRPAYAESLSLNGAGTLVFGG